MANNKSIYDVYFEAGESEGEYAASLSDVQNIWTGIDASRKDLSFDLERIGRTVDSLQAVTELGSTIAGGMESRKEFKSKDLIGTQTEIARQDYMQGLGSQEGSLNWEDFKKTTEGRDYISNFTPVKIGTGGKMWDDYTTLEKMYEKPLYRFGGEDVGHAYSKSDVQGISQFSRYGTPKLDVFQTSLYDEATSSLPPNRTNPITKTVIPELPKKYDPMTGTGEKYDPMVGTGEKYDPMVGVPVTQTTTSNLPGLKVSREELQRFQSSDEYNKTSGKSPLTQYYNWQNSQKGNQTKTAEQLLKENPYK
tara:strand:+ start:3060 stop:3980 length:921 start_codon:yes stop_codon:yes gene_type:complete